MDAGHLPSEISWPDTLNSPHPGHKKPGCFVSGCATRPLRAPSACLKAGWALTPQDMTQTKTPAEILRLGTRASPLALAQTEEIARELARLTGGAIVGEPVPFTTKGDQLTTERLINSGGKGLFTRELDRALDDGEVDVAVHSLKDVPTQLPPGQEFVAFPPRADPRDAFICNIASHPRDLPKGAVLGTASLRREAQSLALRPDLKIVTFRGSVQTRMRKLDEGLADATWLAMAGLERLGLTHLGHPIAPDDILPAAGQGIIGCVARTGTLSPAARAAFDSMTHAPTRCAAFAERAFLGELDGSCRTPIAAHLFDRGGELELRGEVLAPDGSQRWSASGTCPQGADEDALTNLGRRLGRDIRELAGGDLPAFEDD